MLDPSASQLAFLARVPEFFSVERHVDVRKAVVRDSLGQELFVLAKGDGTTILSLCWSGLVVRQGATTKSVLTSTTHYAVV